MTEIAARIPRPRGLAPVLLVAAATAVFAVAAVLALRPHAAHKAHPRAQGGRATPAPVDVAPPAEGPAAAPAEPARPLPTEVLDAAAARGFERDFFVADRHGVFSSSRTVAAWRKLAARAVAGSTIGAPLLEAMIYVESRGHAGAVAGNRAGLTQLTPAMARSAGLHVNVRRSARLTREIGWWVRHGNYHEARRLARARARADRRFAPLAELRATVRFLERAKRELGRTDLAVAAVHLGVGGMRGTVRAFGERDVSYAQLYFGSAPGHRNRIYRRLTAHGTAAYEYYWHVLAAQRILRLYHTRPAKLLWEDRQQHRKNSAEEVLHPRPVAHEFRNPRALANAWRKGAIVHFPRRIRRWHLRVEKLGLAAHAYGASPRLYRGLRPGALGVLLEIGTAVHRLSGSRAPLRVSSAVRDDRYQAVLQRVNVNAARTYSTHTTGFTFDIARSFASRRQERALVWVLNRLTAMNAVAYITESGCYHVSVSARAVHQLGVIRRALAA